MCVCICPCLRMCVCICPCLRMCVVYTIVQYMMCDTHHILTQTQTQTQTQLMMMRVYSSCRYSLFSYTHTIFSSPSTPPPSPPSSVSLSLSPSLSPLSLFRLHADTTQLSHTLSQLEGQYAELKMENSHLKTEYQELVERKTENEQETKRLAHALSHSTRYRTH
jgi:hypothetical protein